MTKDAQSPDAQAVEAGAAAGASVIEPRPRQWLSLLRGWRAAAAGALLLALLAGAVWWCAHRRWQAALAALAEDRPGDARNLLWLPLAVWRWDPDVSVLAARAARMSGDLEAAKGYLQRSMRLAGGATGRVQLEFLLLRVQTGELDQVAPTLIEAADKGHPDGPLILSSLAVAYMNNLRYRPAFACISRWIELEPGSAKAYQYRGWVLERMDRHKEAMLDYRKAMEIDPDLVPVRLRVAEMLLEEKQPHEALPHLERLYRQVPDHPLVQGRLGVCRFLQGRPAEARELMQAAEVHLPNDPILQIHLAKLDLQEGRPAEAERRLRAVVGADPSDAEAWYALIGVVQAQRRPDEAAALAKEFKRAEVVLDRINKLLRQVADGPTARAADHAEIGELLLEVKQETRGLYWLHEALDRDPGQPRAHRALAAYYERKGEPEKAAAHRLTAPSPPPKP
ncbi:MAG: tetratricopeptide repeat protein [Gemmataceae bacterium]